MENITQKMLNLYRQQIIRLMNGWHTWICTDLNIPWHSQCQTGSHRLDQRVAWTPASKTVIRLITTTNRSAAASACRMSEGVAWSAPSTHNNTTFGHHYWLDKIHVKQPMKTSAVRPLTCRHSHPWHFIKYSREWDGRLGFYGILSMQMVSYTMPEIV